MRLDRSEGSRILVCASVGRDSSSMAALLGEAGLRAYVMDDLDETAELLDEQAGVVLLTEEALSAGTRRLAQATEAQPSWSDVPFVLLTSREARSQPEGKALPFATNVIVLERPVGTASLVSTLQAALRARRRQFESRDRMRELAESQRALGISEDRLRLAMDAAAIGLFDFDLATNKLEWDARCRGFFGVGDGPISYEDDFVAKLHPDDREETLEAVSQAFDPKTGGRYTAEYRVAHADGPDRWIAADGQVLFSDGIAHRFVGTVMDVTARRRHSVPTRLSHSLLLRQN